MDVPVDNGLADLKDDASAQDGEIVVRADEIDQTGADITNASPLVDVSGETTSRSQASSAASPTSEDAASSNVATGTVRQQIRPILRREASAPPPPPPRQPPPPAPPVQHDETQLPADSISLGQLRNIVATFPKLEPVAYSYENADTRTFAEELEEWFQYTEEDRDLVESTKTDFETQLIRFQAQIEQNGTGRPQKWLSMPAAQREGLVEFLRQGIRYGDGPRCLECLQGLLYLALGAWFETTTESEEPAHMDQTDFEPPNQKHLKAVAQLDCIIDSADLISHSEVLQDVMQVVWHICEQDE